MNCKLSFILFAGALLFGLAVAWTFYAPHTSALGQSHPLLQAESDTQVCPLSDQQTQDSINAFSAMMPTFIHPRCINCHGAMNPFEANTNHVGGRVGVKFSERTVRDEILGRDVTVVGPEDSSTLRLCQDCHSAVPLWRLPPPEQWFVGKDAMKLCEQMKGSDAESFLDHIENDSLGLIPEAFNGTRGLDENGQGIYEQDTGNDFKPEPPPSSLAQFVQQGRDWIKAMGGNFKGGPTCGCKPHKYVLEINIDERIDSDPDDWTTGHATVRIPITFNEDGTFSGQAGATMVIDLNVTDYYPSGALEWACHNSWTLNNDVWFAEGKVDKLRMDLKLTLQRGEQPEIPLSCTSCSFVGDAHIYTCEQVDFTSPVVPGRMASHDFVLDAVVEESQVFSFFGFFGAGGSDHWDFTIRVVDEAVP